MDSTHIFKLASVATIVMLLISTMTMMPVLGEINSPKKQMKSGVLAEDVICKEGLQLMIRSNGNAICVKDYSTIRLVDSGSAKVIPNNPIPPEEQQVIPNNPIPPEEQQVIPNNPIPPEQQVVTEKQEIVPEQPKEAKSEVTVSVVKDQTILNPTKTIIIEPTSVGYQPGNIIDFSGKAKGSQNLELSLINPNEKEVFYEVLELDSSGNISFQIVTEPSFVEGRYFLIAEQSGDSEITPVLIGHSSEDIHLIVDDFYNKLNSELIIEMYGNPLSEVELTIYDYAEREKFRDEITVNSYGYGEAKIDLTGYKAGIYTAALTHGTEDVDVDFAVGLKTGSTLPVKLSITKEHYIPNDQVLIFGTASKHSAVTLDVINPAGDLVHEIESYSDATGKISTGFELPTNAMTGEWKITTAGKSNIHEITFDVTVVNPPLSFKLDKTEPYETGDILTLDGSGADTVSQIAISVTFDVIIEEFDVFATEDGDFSLIWTIPDDLESGTYTITADDETTKVTQTFEVINTFYN